MLKCGGSKFLLYQYYVVDIKKICVYTREETLPKVIWLEIKQY
jgi:hypothetical protein